MSVIRNAIEVKGLTKRYGSLCAVDHISFEVMNGEFFGFLGPNGAGKTTTARMLTGVIRANEGNATIMGYLAGSLDAKQMSGVVPEMSNAYVDLSGWDNLMFGAELYGVSGDQAKQRATGLLKDMGLLERKSDRVQGYSKGMKQRLTICMALIGDPQVIFLDEPTSGLDVQSTRLIRDLLRKLNEAGKTVFLTTHDMNEADVLCDRIGIVGCGAQYLRLVIGRDTAHAVMRRGNDRNRFAGHIYIAKYLRRLRNARQTLIDHISTQMFQMQMDVVLVRADAAAFVDLDRHGPADHVP